MNHQENIKRHVMVAAVATILLVSVSGLTLGHMVPAAYATKPGNSSNNPALPQSTGTSSPSGSNGGDISNGIGSGGGGGGGSSDFSTQQLTPLDMQGAATAAAASSNAACGQVVTGLVNLTANLNCSGDGLIVGGPNTVINMNGFSITGPGQESSKVAIMVPNVDNVVVNGPGSISNFQAGVLLTGANGFKIISVIISNNQIGTFMTGAENSEVRQNIIQGNSIGVASHSSTGVAIDSNLMNGNLLAGVTFVNTGLSGVDMNNIIGSQNGVFLDGQSAQNAISANNVLENVIDLNNANGLPTNINANQYVDNNCETSNPSGLCIGR
jgi:hypothetical protein